MQEAVNNLASAVHWPYRRLTRKVEWSWKVPEDAPPLLRVARSSTWLGLINPRRLSRRSNSRRGAREKSRAARTGRPDQTGAAGLPAWSTTGASTWFCWTPDYTAWSANPLAAASALSSGRVLKAIAAPGAALRIALMTTSNNARLRGGRRTPPPMTTQS
jgi:hypothetical protein